MVTYSDLILIGQLIVAILNLFVHIYNNKKKFCDFILFWLWGADLQWHCIATPQTGKQRRVPPAAS